MKKPAEFRKIAYFLQIKDLRGKDWCTPSPCRSLREAVEEAAQQVQNMDHYKKVYRDFKAMEGVYIASFFSKPTDAVPARHVVVQITSYELLNSEEIEAALEYIARISEGEKAR